MSTDDAPQPADGLAEVLTLQGGYYVATGVLPFVSRSAFEALTGPKLEWWLVETVGALVTVIGAALLTGARRGNRSPELLAVAYASATALAAIGLIPALARVNSRHLRRIRRSD